MRGGWIYIVTNRPFGTLYIGVTSNLPRRAWEQRASAIDGFTKRYGLTRLVFAEWHDEILLAIQREKAMKHWRRAWKLNVIVAQNPTWDDLFEHLNG